jgi:hypothetical protein
MNSKNIFAKISVGFLMSLSYTQLSAYAAIQHPARIVASYQQSKIAINNDESKLIAENRALLIKNGDFARRIATKLGLTPAAAAIPTTGTPLEQNQSLILQNQKVFRDIAEKVGASGGAMSEVNSADPAEKNHQLLLVNRGIMGSILKKLGITPTPPKLEGSFVKKNNILLKANAAALAKIGAKLGVK